MAALPPNGAPITDTELPNRVQFLSRPRAPITRLTTATTKALTRNLATIALALFAETALAQAPPPTVILPPPLAPGIDAFPKLAGSSPAVRSINTSLTRRDTEALADIRTCLALDGSDWARFIDVTLVTPGFFSLRGTDDFYCAGAAHPEQYIFTLTYDLETGHEVDWPGLLPEGYATLRYPEYPFGANVFGSPLLAVLYFTHYPRPEDDECSSVVRSQDLDFRFWLDGAEKALMLYPENLSHAERACADVAAIPVAALEALGAAPALIKALSSP